MIILFKGWHKMKGYVKDSSGIERYSLEGKWDTELIATNLTDNSQITLWKRQPLPPNSEWYYHFTEFAMNLNHLNVDLIRVAKNEIYLLGTSLYRLQTETRLVCFRNGLF